MKIHYQFSSKLWKTAEAGGWYFITLPSELSKEIREIFKTEEEGWGRLKATAKVGKTEWQTAIWFDTKKNAYLLPIKSAVRKKEKLAENQEIKADLCI
ncbi:MAG: DUF1905 domain-containing protein [Flavobacteriaceae bacterium]|jgi:hypothetical protein|nr:DUF1905 domain-containing protein [Flavobacteriaceae bacterium]